MFNMARADGYRLAHSMGFYMAEIILVLIVIINVASESMSTVLGTDGLRAFQNSLLNAQWTGTTSLKIMSSMTSILIYILLPIYSMTIGFEFSRHIYKNPLSSGMTRLNYFASKYVIFILMALLQLVLYYVLVYLTAGLKTGFGQAGSDFWLKMLHVFGIQYLSLITLFTFATLMMYLSFSVLVTVLATILWPILLTIFVQLFPHAHWLLWFNFQGNVDSAYFASYHGVHLTEFLGSSLGMIVVCLVLAFLIFRRRDL